MLQFGNDRLKFIERDTMFAAGGAEPLVQDCEKLGALLLLQPQGLAVSIKVEAK